MDYAPERDQAVRDSEEETLMNEVTAKLRFYPILMKNAPEGDKVMKESDKEIMMSEINLKPSPRGACTSKKCRKADLAACIENILSQ